VEHDARAAPDEAAVARIAEAASADVRSVWKRLAGGTLKKKVQARVDAAIAEWRAAKEPR
jgi:hypothetical protein